ncbi:MAG: ATP-dependent DNA helicase RecG, partial [Oscillospiraceae bacterium]
MPDLDTSVQYIKGVGEARAKALKKLGIETLSDLVSYFPRAYEDRTAFKTIEELAPGEAVCVRAMVGTQPRLSHIRKGLDLVKFRAVDETGSMEVTFFNQSYLASGIKTGENYVFFGRIGGSPNRPEMTNPVLEPEEKAGSAIGRIMPVYRLTAGISQSVLAKAVRHGLDACGEILPDPLPAGVRMKHNLAQSRFSYENVHFPASFEVLEIARRRLIFEELFVLTCSMAMIRRSRVKHKGLALKKQDIEEFYSVLPFVPTNAQKRAIDDAVSDMCGDKPMSRLIQGDVGSGKTVVSAACAWYAAKNGYQAAIMAPTEILAQQHFETFSQLFSPLDIKVELLKGGMTAKEKREVLGKLESGAASVIIGTHAIISDSVKFSNLGLVVADEQHRFGVAQRSALSSKGEKS